MLSGGQKTLKIENKFFLYQISNINLMKVLNDID